MRAGLRVRTGGRLAVSVLAVAMVTAFGSPAPRAAVRLPPSTTTWPAALTPADLAAIWGQPGRASAVSRTTSSDGVPSVQIATATPAAAVVNTVITFARQQLGLPYQWGGNGPQRGDAGFDCSGLTQSAYATGGVALPRTAHTQFYAGPQVAPGAALRPGDLVFYGTSSNVHHVGLYIGRQVMIHAPTFGQNVQVSHYRWSGDDYVGATQPTAGLGNLGAYTPELPSRLPVRYSTASRPGRGRVGQSALPPAGAPTPTPRPPTNPTKPTVPAHPGHPAHPGQPTPGAPAPRPRPGPDPTEPPPVLVTGLPPLPQPLPTLPPLPLPTLPPLLPALWGNPS
jgi:cell wall-associated NlpC family hydrolase